MDFIFNNEPTYLRRQLEFWKLIAALLGFVLMVTLFVAWDQYEQREGAFKVMREAHTLANFWESEHNEKKRVADRLTRICSSGGGK